MHAVIDDAHRNRYSDPEGGPDGQLWLHLIQRLPFVERERREIAGVFRVERFPQLARSLSRQRDVLARAGA